MEHTSHLMWQPHLPSSCATSELNAGPPCLQQWKDPLKDLNAADVSVIAQTASNNQAVALKKKTRRKRRSTKKQQQQQLPDVCDASTATASTASTTPLSDESLSDNSGAAPLQNDDTKRNRRRRRNRRNRGSRINKYVNVPVPTPDLSDEEKARYVALDCEMVGVGLGGHQSRLARVCVVNWDGDIVYDTRVRVEERVTDYRTFVSGITAEDLSAANTVTFDEARAVVATLLRGQILVGHGLRNDLHVLALSHPWHATRDTARYEPFMRPVDPAAPGYGVPLGVTHVPKKLRVLARDKLGMVIQEEGQPHSPVEDAVAALELYKKHRRKWEKAVEWKVQKTRAISNQS